ncbi:MAG: permease, partial [Mycobacteriales bacterium]
MQRSLGNHRPATVAKASLFGVVSSSCSYAASALAKSLFARGADFTSAMVFMIASTNLVVELGVVLWLLIGWQFALAEFVGGAIMIVLLTLLLPHIVSDASPPVVPAAASELAGLPWRIRIRSRAGWSDAAGYTVSDLTMLRRELVLGFAIAGFLATLVPGWFWRSLFITGHGVASGIENVLLGPFLAIISFVCSVGNVPLAAALWKGGIAFGGVVSFVFADLITLPLLFIYRKYYGTRTTLRLLGAFWAVMSVAGLATQYLFDAVGISPPRHPAQVVSTGFRLDYTTVLDLAALIAFAVIWRLYRTRPARGSADPYAKDPVCGMQVEKAHAPATFSRDGETYWFCSDHCRERFAAEVAVSADSGRSDGA